MFPPRLYSTEEIFIQGALALDRFVLVCYFDLANGFVPGNCLVPGNFLDDGSFLDLNNFLVRGNYYFRYFPVLDCPLLRRAIVLGTRYRRALFLNNCRLLLWYSGLSPRAGKLNHPVDPLHFLAKRPGSRQLWHFCTDLSPCVCLFME